MNYKYKGAWYELGQELSTTVENKIKKVANNITEKKVGNSKANELTELVKSKLNLKSLEVLDFAYISDKVLIVSKDNHQTLIDL